LDKIVKEVFKDCASDKNLFNLASIKEVKFSKKLNAAIIDSYSQ